VGEEKAFMCHDSFDNYPDAMNCYKSFKSAIEAEPSDKIRDWFVTITRIYLKGNRRQNEIIKTEGTI
jgi:hypothetical protein